MNHLLIHAWALYKQGDDYYLPYTHWIYLKEITRHAQLITLLSPVKQLSRSPTGMHRLSEIQHPILVKTLPFSRNYIAAIKYFFHYRRAYARSKECSHAYVRYPAPFGWLSRFYFKKDRCIFHFVGDPMHTVRANRELSTFQQKFLTGLFMPEHLLYMRACKGAKVFTNGTLLKDKLARHGVAATALVSSTLVPEDYFFDEEKSTDAGKLKLLYLGYFRKTKGLETLLEAFQMILEKYPGSMLTVAGSGELEARLKEKANAMKLTGHCVFIGHIEDRQIVNQLLRRHDVFIFPSLSEGSPRVVLEAMANGLPVISTPVGSLPATFKNGEELLFVKFNSPAEIFQQLDKLVRQRELINCIRSNAFSKVKQFTLQQFIKRIFGEA